MRRVAILFVLLWFARPASATTNVIHLVGPADQAAQQSAANFLGPNPGEFPSHAPGPIVGSEIVHVSLAPDGTIAGIDVAQALTIHGVGDFSIEISGPALKVTAPPDASAQPGLRRGSVIWDGFSSGTRTVRATITLDPHAVRFLPLPLGVSISKNGNTTELRIVNQTAASRPYEDGVPDRSVLARALDVMRADLGAGRAPIAGTGGIPSSIPSGSGVATSAVDVPVAFALHIGHVDATLGGEPIVVEQPDATAAIPEVIARPALPGPGELIPSGGARSWTDALAHASDAELRDALRLVQRTLWEALRRSEYEAYLGNPLGGTSEARYEYGPAAAIAPFARPREPERPKPLAIALAVTAILGAGAAATRWWLRH